MNNYRIVKVPCCTNCDNSVQEDGVLRCRLDEAYYVDNMGLCDDFVLTIGVELDKVGVKLAGRMRDATVG